MKHLKYINESTSQDAYKIARIISIINDNEMPYHNKILNLSKVAGISNIDLPPLIIPCEITLNDGETHIAYLEENMGIGHPDDEDYSKFIWIEYGKIGVIRSFKKDSSRKRWKLSDVKSWKYIKKR